MSCEAIFEPYVWLDINFEYHVALDHLVQDDVYDTIENDRTILNGLNLHLKNFQAKLGCFVSQLFDQSEIISNHPRETR